MIRLCSLVLIACTLLTSCGDDEGFTNAPIPSGRLSYVNTIPDSPELIVVTNNLRTGNIPFGASTPNTNVLPQIPLDYRISYIDDNVDTTFLEGAVTLEIDFANTVILSGSFAAPVVTEIVDTPFDYATDSTDTRIRFMNASSGVASATATITNPNGTDETIIMTNGQPTGFTTITAGTGIEIEVTDTSSGAVLWRSGETTLSPRGDRLFVLQDYFGPGDETVRLVSINDPSGNPNVFTNEEIDTAVRFVNQAATLGPLDFYIDDVLLATLPFNGVSEYLSAPSGSAIFRVTPAGDNDTELANGERIFFIGSFHTLQVASNADGTGIGTGSFVENTQPIATAARVQITTLAPAVAQLDLYFQDQGEALGGIPDFTQVLDFTTGAITVPPQAYDFYVTETGNQTALIGPETLNLEARGNYTIQIIDSEGGGTPLQLQLLDDFQD